MMMMTTRSSPDPTTAPRRSPTVSRVRSWTLTLPLEQPLRLGRMTLSEREYVVVRVDVAGDDRFGVAWSMTRGLPTGAALDAVVAPHAVGKPIDAVAAIWQEACVSHGPAGRGGVAMRALSLLDIALWDLRARLVGLPLHAMLGQARASVPVMAVAAYPNVRSPEESGERLAELSAAGHPRVKLHRWPDPRDTRTVVERASAAGAGEIVIDAAWAWEDAREALAELRQWGDLPLAWIEDPIPAERSQALRRLRCASRYLIGVGDELVDTELARLAREDLVDILRLDATVAGGITGAQRLLGICWHLGIPVSLHVNLPMHVHLAASSSACLDVETYIGPDAALDPADRLLAAPPTIEAGEVAAPTGEGLGCELDWELIEATATATGDTGEVA
jgi:L-alanine-DL-glutamate epimerase-like enolase superfamily enzyme